MRRSRYIMLIFRYRRKSGTIFHAIAVTATPAATQMSAFIAILLPRPPPMPQPS